MNSPNNIVIDHIRNDHIVAVHKALDLLRDQYGVRVRIKQDGRTSSALRALPPADQCYEEAAE